MQATDSFVGPSSFPLSSPIIEARTSPPVPAPAILLGSHPMVTRVKAGIFKTLHPANLGVLGSSRLLSTLLVSIEPKGFKSAAKNPAWLASMDDEVQVLQNNHT